MHELVSQVRDGWDLDKDGNLRRTSCVAGDIAKLICSAPYELRFNELSMEVQLDGVHVTSEWMETAYVEFQEQGWNAKKNDAYDAILRVAKESRFHPVEQYFRRVEKDDSITPIDLSSFGRDYFGVSGELANEMFCAFLRGAVWRVFEPGCQFDAVLTLKGPQGIRKTSALRALVPDPEWFSSSSHDQLKDQTIALHRVLITELGELEHHTGKRSAGALKNLITNPRDLQRVPYGRAYQFMPRRSVLAASVNGDDFLRDITGNRRFWVVDLPQQQHIDVIDTDRIERDRDRIWKAAIAQYRAGMQPMLSAAHQGQSDKQNEGYAVENPFVSAVERRCLPFLKASPGFPMSLAIEESLVCASIEKTDEGDRIIQRPPTTRDTQLMAECLKELGFERDKNAKGKERTRKWRFCGTDDTGSVDGSVSAESPVQPLEVPTSDTHTQGCLGNLSDLGGGGNAGIKKFGKRSVRVCQDRPVGSGADVDSGDDDPHWGPRPG